MNSFISPLAPCSSISGQALNTSLFCVLRSCPAGTFSPYQGLSDVSQCLPCPPGRVCGIAGMISLNSSVACSAGYTCGAGTSRELQFNHQCPAGYYCYEETVPEEQYANMCPEVKLSCMYTRSTKILKFYHVVGGLYLLTPVNWFFMCSCFPLFAYS